MSGRFILILVGAVLVIAAGVVLLVSLGQVGRRIFNDLRWMANRIATKHLPPPPSYGGGREGDSRKASV